MGGEVVTNGYLVILLEQTGLLAVLAIVYQSVYSVHKLAPVHRQAIIGLSFGLAASLMMQVPIELGDELIFDVRAVPQILSAAFAGPVGGVITALCVVVTRVVIGGPGVLPALVSAAGMLALGLGLWAWRRRTGRLTVWHLALTGVASAVPLTVALSLLGWQVALQILQVIGLPIVFATAAGVTLVGWLLVTEDRRRAAETALERASRDAQAASRAKSAFLSQISHELRTPIAAIVGAIDLHRVTGATRDPARVLSTIGESASHMLALLDDLLDMSRIEAGHMPIVAGDVRLRDLLRECEDLHRSAAKARGLTLRLEVDPALPEWILADRVRLRQVLNNLIGNAIKFTSEGSVTVSIGREPAGGSEGAAPGVLVIGVRDTGIGIARERQEAIFDVFEQAERGIAVRYGGTGLGLAISRGLARKMGGDLAVESDEGAGSTFTLRLPLREGTPQPEADPLPEASVDKPLAGLSILVAEDVAPIRRMTVEMLTAFGARTAEAVNGLEAVAAVEDDRFDVVLMDMQMPEMDGKEATLAIRALPGEASRLPIIALTADAIRENRAEYHTLGLDGFLTKPVPWRELIDLIDHLLNRRRQTPEAPAAGGPAEAEAAIDRERLDGLITVLGRAHVADLLEQAVAGLTDAHRRLGALDPGDPGQGVEIRRTLHTIKGMAGNFGLLRLQRLAEEGEHLAPEDLVRRWDALVGALSAAFGQLGEEASRLRGRKGRASGS